MMMMLVSDSGSLDTLASLGHTDADDAVDHSCNLGEDDDDVGVRFRVT